MKPILLAAEPWVQTMSAGPLLLIAVAAIVLILVSVILLRLHAFLTLIVVSLLTAVAAGIPASQLLSTLTNGFSSTLGSVALLVGIGAMLGKLVEASGGAKVLADSMVRIFGEQRAPLALGVASLILGFPIFFDAGFIVMLPVIFAVAHRLGGNILLYAIPSAAAFSVMHVFLPPHPGPVGAGTIVQANMGLVMVLGIVVAIPSFYVSGVLWGRYCAKHTNFKFPNLFGTIDDADLPKTFPPVGTVIFTLVLPALLISLNTGVNALVQSGVIDGVVTKAETNTKAPTSAFVEVLLQIGQTPIALLISTFIAIILLGRYIGTDRIGLEKIMDSALGPVCSVILVTGAGGMFGGVLRTSGIGGALSDTMNNLGIPLLLATYLVSVALRLAQGSATVALITSISLMAPAVADAGLSDLGVACIVLAASAGSVFASHVNDSGFWLVGRLLGMDVKTTLRTWTVQQTLESVVGFALVALLYVFA
ncbi:GntP family permease [Arcanobacterium bovis]|uniref:GntP family permease n=1 Tax=Arcanobacterium bovis TaxID=2529275 RepID=A0A4Q9V2J3_9ACTO|nr:GntP family permease [Arcanobacterium bovis]TBW23871.1 GntP family permease [Arcanobacterium bovis]